MRFRPVREILPELIHQIISLTSSPEPEQQEVLKLSMLLDVDVYSFH
jgi:hypothetical protein